MATTIVHKIYNITTNLTKAEKSYIRKNLQIYKDESDLLYFFDKISKLQQYDSKKVDAIFFDKIKTTNVSQQLIKNIVRSLFFFHANKSNMLMILQYLIEVEIFLEKKEYELMYLSMKKGIELTNQMGNLFFNTKFRYYKEILLHVGKNQNNYNAFRKNTINMLENVDVIHTNILNSYSTQIIYHITVNYLLPLEGYNDIKDDSIFNMTLSKIKQPENSLHINYCSILKSIGKWEEAYSLTIAHLENKKKEKKKYPALYYFPILVLLTELEIQLKLYTNIQNRIESIHKIISSNTDSFTVETVQYNNYCYIDFLNIIYFTNQNKKIEKQPFFTNIIKLIDDADNKHRTTAIKFIIWHYFMQNEPDKAQLFLMKEYNHPNFKNLNPAEIYFLRWFSVFIYFELKEISLFNSSIKSLNRTINKFRPYTKWELQLKKALNLAITSQKGYKEALKECLNQLKLNREMVRSAFDIFDLIEWIEKK